MYHLTSRNPRQPCEVATVIIPIVFRKELKHRKVQALAGSHTGRKWLAVAEGLGESHIR